MYVRLYRRGSGYKVQTCFGLPTEDRAVQARLIERGGERGSVAYPLAGDTTTIGRKRDNDIVLAADHVSRHHARVVVDGGHYILHDQGSKNGTFVNGRRIAAPQPLQDGDVITLSGRPAPAFVFEMADETVTVAPEETEGGIWIDTRTAEVQVRGRQVRVTAKEYLALALLYQRAGALVTKEELAGGVWPEYQGAVSDHNIEQLISRLRAKLEENPERPRLLVTVRGLGYRLMVF